MPLLIRYVVVIPLMNREATTSIPKFLDQVIFRQGPPDTLHSDAAQEFLSESLELLAQAAHIELLATMPPATPSWRCFGGIGTVA